MCRNKRIENTICTRLLMYFKWWGWSLGSVTWLNLSLADVRNGTSNEKVKAIYWLHYFTLLSSLLLGLPCWTLILDKWVLASFKEWSIKIWNVFTCFVCMCVWMMYEWIGIIFIYCLLFIFSLLLISNTVLYMLSFTFQIIIISTVYC